jgi:Zinc knuckle
MHLVSKAKTKEWPEGLVYLVAQELRKKFKPNVIISKVEMRQKLNHVSMKKGSDPAILFETLAAIEDQYDGISDIKESDLISVVLDIATQKYQAIFTAELSNKGNQLTLHDLETVMTQHYCQINQGKTTKREEEGEVLVTAVNGACYICSKKGHMANNCPNRENNNADKKSISNKCLNCNKKGHLAKDCWFKESNKDIKSNKDESSEKAAAMINDVNNLQEYLLGTLDNSNMINDQDLWIADLEATVHMTPYQNGLNNIKKVDNIGTITIGNGTMEQITDVADVLGTISVKNEKKRVRIQDVTILKNGRFNLFSLSQMLKKGWKLTGNDEYIAISKGDLEIRFHQRIPTKNGILYGIQIAREDEFVAEFLTPNLSK